MIAKVFRKEKTEQPRNDLPAVFLYRWHSDDAGTLGRWAAPGFSCYSLELPDRRNRSNLSRIPAGEYFMDWIKPARAFSGFTELYWIHDVKDRFGILCHPGTWAGDTTKGMRSDSWGCVLLGLNHGHCLGQRAIFNSRTAVRQFHEVMQRRRARLIITEGDFNA